MYSRKRARAAEDKFFDTDLSFNLDITGEVPATGQLVLIPQGATESTRIGCKCVIESIHLRGTATCVFGASAAGATIGYWFLVLDKQCNGAAAAITDIFTNADLSTAMYNRSNSDRFVILRKWEHVYMSSAGATTAYNNVPMSFDIYKKCTIPIEYSSTAGAITEIRSNNIFLCAGTDGRSDDIIQCVGTCRVTFSDQ